MKAGRPKPADELRMSGKEFDRIMGQALQVKPKAQKPKQATKTVSYTHLCARKSPIAAAKPHDPLA